MARSTKRVVARLTSARPKAGGAASIRSVLQEYADRGVFRGLSITERTGGRIDCDFLWLLGRPIRVSYDPAKSTLAFPALFPAITSSSPVMAVELRAAVRERSTAGVPAHKRIDRRRAELACSLSRGALSLTAEVRGSNHEYVVRRVLNLINDLFLLLHQSYPDYLEAQFGLSSE
jgi:hypothetical protein